MTEPFAVNVAAADIDDLLIRLRHTRWPSGVTDSGGFEIREAQRLTSYWADAFDWYEQQRVLNSYPQFAVSLDGQRVHFLHIESRRSDSMPLLLLHGWPGSFIEFLSVVDRLRDSYDIVVPSLPGYGFSSPALSPGMSNKRMADVMSMLMTVLGYERFGVHGGDVGAGVATWLAFKYPERLIGLHLNYIPGSYAPALQSGATEEEAEFFSPELRLVQTVGSLRPPAKYAASYIGVCIERFSGWSSNMDRGKVSRLGRSRVCDLGRHRADERNDLLDY